MWGEGYDFMKNERETIEALLKLVNLYIDDNCDESFGIRHFRHQPTSNATKQALKNIIKTVLNLRSKTFSERLVALIEKKGYKPADIYLNAGVTKQHFSKIRTNPDYHPSKETALAFAIVLQLTIEETRELISSAGFTLSSSNRRDLVVECLIKERVYDIDIVNDILDELGFSPLTNRRNNK